MKIGIVGWGLEAQSAFRFFGPDHDYLIVNESEQDNFPPRSEKVKVQFLHQKAPVGIGGQVTDLSYLDGIEACDKIIYQPTAIFNLQRAFQDRQDFWAKATTVYDIFFEHRPTQNIIGVTGTKGKGTTSTLIAKMLEASGKNVHLGGNIGTPILDLLPKIKSDDWLVWELANFQLKPASYSPHIAVCLMIVPEHMDWHPNVNDYIESKANIFRHQKAEDIAIYFAENEYSKKIANYSPGQKIPYYSTPGAHLHDTRICIDHTDIAYTPEVKLLGKHNLQNICAAITAVWQVDKNVRAIKQVITTFTGLEHRLEFVREVGGVKYYDDSFATTPETTAVAMQAVPEPKVMILGGHDKGADYEALADDVIDSNVRHVIAIGLIGPRIARQLKAGGFDDVTEGLTDMKSIVAAARQNARAGDAVVLSAGTSSFGLFKDYKDRGNQFKQAVRELS